MMPGALLAWASQVGLGMSPEAVTVNGGALVATLVMIIMFVLGAMAAFERQEL